MFIVQSYPLAIFFCFVTMLCWGSWGNTQKLAAKTWRYELFYWDYVIGLLLFSLLSAFTLGSFGTEGRSFLDDLMQADGRNLFSAFLGGVVFNASNILLAAAVALCGMSVAFPVGVGLALVLGVLINYFGAAKGDPLFIFLGVALIAAAIVMNGLAYDGPDRETETYGERASDLGRGGHDHGLFLPVCRLFDGPRQFHGSRSRKDDSLHGGGRLRGGCIRQQFSFQYDCHEVSGGGYSGPSVRVFRRNLPHASGRHARRCDLVPGRILQHDRLG